MRAFFLTLLLLFSFSIFATVKFDDISFFSSNMEYDFKNSIIKARGKVEVNNNKYNLIAQNIIYNINSKELSCFGDVSLSDKQGNVIYGNEVLLKNNFSNIFVKDFKTFLPDNITIKALKAESFADRNSNLEKVSYTACNSCSLKQPFWSIVADNTKIDRVNNRIILKNAYLKLRDSKIFYTPYISVPTPDAPAQSGALIPILEQNSLRIPMYFRIKPNMDTTITPRIVFGGYKTILNTLYELEFRHLITWGDYKINASIAPNDKTFTDSKYEFIDFRKVAPFFIFAKGDFVKRKENFGFDINFVSNERYLKKYYDDYRSYLITKGYWNSIFQNYFYEFQVLSFDDLRDHNIFKADEPLLFPKYKYKIYHNFAKGINLSNEINTDLYFVNKKKVARFIHNLTLDCKKILNDGFVLDFNIYNVTNFYYYGVEAESKHKEGVKINYSPSIQTMLSYPLVYKSDSYNTILTPFMKIVAVDSTLRQDDNLELIDQKSIYLGSYNFLKPNYYSGFDYSEQAVKLLYGFEQNISQKNSKFINLFLGKVHYLTNENSAANHHVVFRANYFPTKHLELYHVGHFTLDRFENFRNDFGLKVSTAKSDIKFGVVSISDVKKEYNINLYPLGIDKSLIQTNFSIKHKFSESWSMKYGSILSFKDGEFNLSKGLLKNWIGVTYKNECTLISLSLDQSFTSDKKRDINNLNAFSVQIGLKTLNL